MTVTAKQLLPEVLEIYPMHGFWILITSVDYHTDKITAKYFAAKEAALEDVHTFSLLQFPVWHVESCPVCASRKHK